MKSVDEKERSSLADRERRRQRRRERGVQGREGGRGRGGGGPTVGGAREGEHDTETNRD